MYKIIGADGKEYGPITADQLRQWIAEGRVNAQTKILLEGTSAWKLLGEFPEFATAVPSPPAPPFGFQPPSAAAVEGQVKGPAIGLLVTAILGLVLQAGSLVMKLMGTMFTSRTQDLPAWAAVLSGTLGVVLSVMAIVVGLLILFGALKMKRLENYGLAMTASVLAMIPCVSPCCLIGLPIGIWALVILMKPEVKAAFH